ncbi:hypothetical protein H0H87_012127 [Tephrocybe sp. NHM501043]|nr:hypothetical protein H0H87_012127 [Tephrocybe sp. NHM501043]
MVAVNAFAVISSVALVSVACRVIWLAIIQNMSPEATKPKEYVFFNTQLGYYAACLLIGNLFTDISGLIGLRWVMDKGITPGGLCTLQAVLMQLGNWAIAYFTVAIAVHTFNSLVLKIRQSVIVSAIAIFVGWASAALLAAGPFIDSTGYGVSGISCGIRPTNPKAQFFYHLFPAVLGSHWILMSAGRPAESQKTIIVL